MSSQILLVDDHPMFLAGTRMILEKHGYQVAAAASAAEAQLAFTRSSFDLYLYDLNLPGVSGFELTRLTLEHTPEARIVILTGEVLGEHYDRLIELGVSGLLEKASTEEELIAGLKLAFLGHIVLPLQLARQLRIKSAPASSEASPGQRKLTDNEIKVLQQIAQGHKNKDIAAALFMSQRNVEYVISNLFEKLKASSRQETVIKAKEQGYL